MALIPAFSDYLHYHRVFVRTKGNPLIEKEEPLAKENEVEAFIYKVLSVVCNKIIINRDHIPHRSDIAAFWQNPMSDAYVEYFHSDIVEAVQHQCAIDISLQNAKKYLKFDVSVLGELKTDAGKIEQVRGEITSIIANVWPKNISFIYGLAFASCMCVILAENECFHLAPGIVKATTEVFLQHFPYDWIYHDFRKWAFAYSFRHRQIPCINYIDDLFPFD